MERQTRPRSGKKENSFQKSRKLEERSANLNPVMHMDWSDPLYIPPEWVPEGYEYRWMRFTFNNGEEDTARPFEIRRKGWTAVPAHRHPELGYCDLDSSSRFAHLKGCIFHRGLVLHERPKYLGDRERERINQSNMMKLKQMPAVEDFRLMNDPYMQGKYIANPEVSFGNSYDPNF